MRQVFWPLAGTLLMQTVSSMIFLTVPVLAPALAAATSFEASQVGLYSALMFLGAMPVSLVTGVFISRWGPVRLMQVGMLLSGASMLLGLSGLDALILLSGVLVGMGYGPNTPAASHILAQVTAPKDRPLVFSIKQSGAPLGGALAGLLVPLAVIHGGWQSGLLLASGLSVLTILAVQPLRRSTDTDRGPAAAVAWASIWAQMRPLFASAELRRLTVASFTYAGIQMCTFAYMVTFLVQRVELDLVAAGLAFSAMQVAGVSGRIGWGAIADRWLPARIVIAGLGIASALFLATAAWFSADWPFAAIAAICVCIGATASGWNGVFLAEVARAAPPGQIGAATGGIVFFTYFGLVVGPTLFSILLAVSDSYVIAFNVIAAAILLPALLMLLPARRSAG